MALLREQGYGFCDYHSYEDTPRCVILRHDIDFSPEQAVRLAELEAAEGVRSTWFVLLRTAFYNPASKTAGDALRRILSFGHEIGLHFDEAAYVPAPEPDAVAQNIAEECGLLSALLKTGVSVVSMHRPSQAALEADYALPGIVNAYGKAFFREFKYLSDSRRRWREPVEAVIRSGEYDRLHLLIHPVWYHEAEESLTQTVKRFVLSANRERYDQLAENLTDIKSILTEDAL